MRVAIFYFKKTEFGKPTLVEDDDNIHPIYADDIRIGTVRVFVVEAADVEEALAMAEPRDGESVMNTHEI